LNIGTGAAYIL